MSNRPCSWHWEFGAHSAQWSHCSFRLPLDWEQLFFFQIRSRPESHPQPTGAPTSWVLHPCCSGSGCLSAPAVTLGDSAYPDSYNILHSSSITCLPVQSCWFLSTPSPHPPAGCLHFSQIRQNCLVHADRSLRLKYELKSMVWEHCVSILLTHISSLIVQINVQNINYESNIFVLPRKLWPGLSSTTRILRAPAGMMAASI